MKHRTMKHRTMKIKLHDRSATVSVVDREGGMINSQSVSNVLLYKIWEELKKLNKKDIKLKPPYDFGGSGRR